MDKITLAVANREETGKKVAKLRREGQVPAVLYGHGVEPQAVKADFRELTKVYANAGTSKIIGVKVDDKNSRNALINDVQRHPRTGDLLHADLYIVRMDEKLKTEVPLHFTGESTAVYQQEGTLVKNLETIEVEALPGDLPESLEVDISVLDDFEKSIHVRDLKVPAGVELLVDAEELIAKVDPPRSDEELAELDEEVTEEIPGEEVEAAEGEAEAKAEGEAAPEA